MSGSQNPAMSPLLNYTRRIRGYALNDSFE
jgi:hypothetical protein